MNARFPRKIVALLAGAALVAGGTVASATAKQSRDLPAKFDAAILSPEASPRAIVGFDHDVTSATIRRLSAAGIGKAVVLDTIDAVGVLGPRAAYMAIARWADVQYVAADLPLQLDNYSAKKDTFVDDVRAGKPPLRSKYDGKGVTVAVIDTGIQSTHPDLDDRVIKDLNFEPGWFFDSIYDGTYSDQVAETTGNKVDSYGHGTHVAGIVAGTGEAGAAGGPEVDMSGVAPGADLVNFKIADVSEGLCLAGEPCDFGWEINALVAYEYLIEHRNDEAFPGGIRVATNSWSVFEVDSDAEPITLIVEKAAEKGIINLFAASNDGPGEDTVAPGPNSLEEVITVAASCKSDDCGLGNIADFSSRGPQVDVAAPGVNIYSTWAQGSAFPSTGHAPPGPPENRAWYVSASGTSMATPHVAGIVALMLEANPKLTQPKIEKILTKTAFDYGAKGFDTAFGFGQVNALKSVAAAERLK
ncbi:MAG TPA: S8 family serine peptidase [Actinomycetota bacterium]|jgi:serine protease AprX